MRLEEVLDGVLRGLEPVVAERQRHGAGEVLDGTDLLEDLRQAGGLGDLGVAGGDLGGTMRLGAFRARLEDGSHIAKIYGTGDISERHRHRYEVNMSYRKKLEDKGLLFAGVSPDGLLPETVEYPDHPWFIGVQYHPELKSRPFEPHPLFASFIAAAVEQARMV